MRIASHSLALLSSLALFPSLATAQDLPHVQRNGSATQLMVEGKPYLALGGELHNSSASSPAYMAPIWDRLEANNVKTVISVASWDQTEPSEGHFNFSALDDQIKQARAHNLHLVLIWFGAFKNADSSYAPGWVRRDTQRFPRVERDPSIKPHGIVAYLGFNPTVSALGGEVLKADAKAFAAMMRHVREIDTDRRVIMVQVENEPGVLGDSRDRSAPALRAWEQAVPPALIAYMTRHAATLNPDVLAAWQSHGSRKSGSWPQVFGTDKIADEIFMAWSFGSYVDHVAKAGAAEYPLPMYTNAWLGRTPGAMIPGDYPSGGAVAHMIDIWKAAAPTLAFVSPDIYIDAFPSVAKDYHRGDNPLFVPEAKPDPANLFVAVGAHDAIGFSPFGIEDVASDSKLFQAYRMLGGMSDIITSAQAEGRIAGFRVEKDAHVEQKLGGYTLSLTRSISTVGAMGAGTGSDVQQQTPGFGLAIANGKDAFIIVGSGINLRFSAEKARVEIDSVQEGTFANGVWTAGRSLNGDERYALFPADRITAVRVTVQAHALTGGQKTPEGH